MNKEKILQWLGSNIDFCIIKAVKQHWYKRKYSYLTEPRPDFGLLLVESGSVDFFTEKGTLSAGAGNLVFLPQGSHYEAIFADRAEDFLVCFKADVAYDFALEPMILLDRSPASCAEIMRFISEKNKHEKQTKLYNKGLFYLLLDSILANIEEKYDEHSLIVKRAGELIQKNTGASIESVARECAVSGSALRQMFIEKTGISPVRYRTNIRLRQAMYLIESTDLSLNEIAESLSFFDAAYFCKVFKAHTGMTPKEYAKNKKL